MDSIGRESMRYRDDNSRLLLLEIARLPMRLVALSLHYYLVASLETRRGKAQTESASVFRTGPHIGEVQSTGSTVACRLLGNGTMAWRSSDRMHAAHYIIAML